MLKDILRSAAAPLLKVILLSVECWLRRNDFVLSREGEEFSWEPTPYPYPLLNMYPPILVIISCFVSFVIKAAQRRKCVRSRHYSSCVRASPLQSLNLNTTCPVDVFASLSIIYRRSVRKSLTGTNLSQLNWIELDTCKVRKSARIWIGW